MLVTSKIMKLRLIISVILICGSIIVSAQSKKDRYDAIIRTELHQRYKGLLLKVDESGLTIRFHTQDKYIAAGSIRSIRIKRYNAQNKSFLAGSLLGLGGGLTIYGVQKNKGNLNQSVLPVVIISSVVTGAAVAGALNSAVSVVKFQNVQKKNFYDISSQLKKFSQSGK